MCYSDVQHTLCCAESEVRVHSANCEIAFVMLVHGYHLAYCSRFIYLFCTLEVGRFTYIIISFDYSITQKSFVNIAVHLTVVVMILESEGLRGFRSVLSSTLVL